MLNIELGGTFAAALRLALGAARPDLTTPRLAMACGFALVPLQSADGSCDGALLHGQDAVAEQTLPILGVSIRDMHPPDAAVGLEQSPEFPQHFTDSYEPLIHAALANNQPVIAWQGCSTAPLAWGVIRRFDKVSGVFDYAVATADGKVATTTTLDRAAVQCYVLEYTSAAPADDSQLLAASACACRLLADDSLLAALNLKRQ